MYCHLVDEVAQEVIEHEEQIEQIERRITELLDSVARLRRELARRKRRVQELLVQAVPDDNGEILSYADLLA